MKPIVAITSKAAPKNPESKATQKVFRIVDEVIQAPKVRGKIATSTLTPVKGVVLREVLKPETDLEGFLLEQGEIQQGMLWGIPRFGHPEGAVWKHVVEVLANVDRLPGLSQRDRHDLRLAAFVHDTFKYVEDKSEPRDWTKHHGILARKFLQRFSSNQRVLDLVEWHDEAYYCWRLEALHGRAHRSRQRLDVLLERFGKDMPLYYRFFVCDTRTGDKNLAPLRWFRERTGLELMFW